MVKETREDGVTENWIGSGIEAVVMATRQVDLRSASTTNVLKEILKRWKFKEKTLKFDPARRGSSLKNNEDLPGIYYYFPTNIFIYNFLKCVVILIIEHKSLNL